LIVIRELLLTPPHLSERERALNEQASREMSHILREMRRHPPGAIHPWEVTPEASVPPR
jgi:hypothetical protein